MIPADARHIGVPLIGSVDAAAINIKDDGLAALIAGRSSRSCRFGWGCCGSLRRFCCLRGLRCLGGFRSQPRFGGLGCRGRLCRGGRRRASREHKGEDRHQGDEKLNTAGYGVHLLASYGIC